MVAGIVPAAAVTSLPDADVSSAALPEGAAPFDQTLDARLQGADGAPTGDAPKRRFADPLALAEWMLLGAPAQQVDEMPAAGDAVTQPDEIEPSPDEAGDTLWDLAADGLLATPAPVQDADTFRLTADATGEVSLTAEATGEAGLAAEATGKAGLTTGGTGVTSVTTDATGEAGVAMESTGAPRLTADATGEGSLAADTTRDRPGTTEAAGAHGLKTDAAADRRANAGAIAEGRLGTPGTSAGPRSEGADAASAASATTPVGRLNPAGTADSADGQSAHGPSNSPVSNSGGSNAPVNNRADQSVPQRAVNMAAPVDAPVGAAQAVSNIEPIAADAAVPAPILERDSRDGAAAAPRVATATFAAQRFDAAMSGGDAQHFEGDRRQSPAAARLAAALSLANAPASRESGSAPAPVFSLPAPPAAVTAVAAPIAAAAPVPTDAASDAENVTRLVEAMRVTARGGGWEATVRLKPHHLGEVTIALRVDGNSVSATIGAEAAGVRQWLLSQEDAVRSGMAEHGLHLDRFQVHRDGQRREEPQQKQQWRRPAPRRQGEEPERFEIVV